MDQDSLLPAALPVVGGQRRDHFALGQPGGGFGIDVGLVADRVFLAAQREGFQQLHFHAGTPMDCEVV